MLNQRNDGQDSAAEARVGNGRPPVDDLSSRQMSGPDLVFAPPLTDQFLDRLCELGGFYSYEDPVFFLTGRCHNGQQFEARLNHTTLRAALYGLKDSLRRLKLQVGAHFRRPVADMDQSLAVLQCPEKSLHPLAVSVDAPGREFGVQMILDTGQVVARLVLGLTLAEALALDFQRGIDEIDTIKATILGERPERGSYLTT